jgi:hypothetical protein
MKTKPIFIKVNGNNICIGYADIEETRNDLVNHPNHVDFIRLDKVEITKLKEIEVE